MPDLESVFEQTFNQVSKVDVHAVANLMRFSGVLMVLSATALAMIHFLSALAKENDHFIPHLTQKIVKILIGLCLFILVLKP